MASEATASTKAPEVITPHHAVALTEDQAQQLRRDLTQQLGPEAAATVTDDATLQRFFRATAGNLAASCKRLASTAKWRHQHQPQRLECSACLADPCSHYMHLCGHDKSGRPVMYSTFALVGNRSVQTLLDHMVQAFEMCVRAMPEGVEQWVWLNDFIGFGMADMNPALALSFINLMGSHYPERLGQLLVLDAPGFMTPLWNMVRPFIDPATHKKIRFVPNDLHLLQKPKSGKASQLHAALQELCGEELQKWVCEEMAAVRRFAKRKGPRPRYDLGELRRCVAKGCLPGGPAAPASGGASGAAAAQVPDTAAAASTPAVHLAPAAVAACHNHYGTGTLLHLLMDRPELIGQSQVVSPTVSG